MKKWILFFLFLGINLSAFAQNRFVGGSFGFGINHGRVQKNSNFTNNYLHVFLNPTYGKIKKSSEYGVSVLARYAQNNRFFTNNLGVTSSNNSKMYGVGIQPFYRKKWSIFEKCVVFGELNLPILWSENKSEAVFLSITQTDRAGFGNVGIGGRGGFQYLLHKNWRLEAQFALLEVKINKSNPYDNYLTVNSAINTSGWISFAVAHLFTLTKKGK
jgi:hypothetical protein